MTHSYQSCGDWDCECAFRNERSCCCAQNDYSQMVDNTVNRVVNLWNDVAQLEGEIERLTEGQKVAFTANFTVEGCYGPHTSSMPIPYNIVLLNEGNGFNKGLGVFMTPFAGVYSFTFTTSSQVEKNQRMYYHVQLIKNGEPVVSVWEDNRDDAMDSATQNVLLELSRGDLVYVQLLPGRKICREKRDIVNVFSGYMVYPSS
ncbi:cerebellin 18 [Conger conger]|uniref:cerebellin 18 n=1 Tax=Conger conger TaxID=82655 RepID=UPI002A5ADFBB|nr:cerebellin 18 [Conger conger]